MPESPLDYVAEHCAETRTSLSVEEAYVVLEPYFLATKEIFEPYDKQEHGRKSKLKRVRLEISRVLRDSPRHFAATTDDGMQVVLAPEMAELPEETVLAIMSHEFGHVLDMLYPAEYVLEGEQVRRVPVLDRDTESKLVEQALVARMRQWEKRDRDTVEITADAIAEKVTGKSIGYRGPCLLQSFEGGVKRPEGLR